MEKKKRVLQEADESSNILKMRKHNDDESEDDEKISKCSVKSFYGSNLKERSKHSWGIWPAKYVSSCGKIDKPSPYKSKVKKIKKLKSTRHLCDSSSDVVKTDSGISSQSESTCSNIIEKNVSQHDGIDICEKKINKESLLKTEDEEIFYHSVESQTSFPSSHQSSEDSPVCYFRESPFLCTVQSSSENSPQSVNLYSEASSFKCEEPLPMNESQTIDIFDNTTKTEVSVSKIIDEEELCISHNSTENGSIDSSEHPLNNSAKSNSSLDEIKPIKISPQRNTILNYFNRTESSQKCNMSKVSSTPKESTSQKCSSRQMLLKNGKVSPDTKHLFDAIPLFDLPVSPRGNVTIKKKMKSNSKTNPKIQKREQMYIDIGQKDFGHVTCATCGMVYMKSQEEDEAQHAKYHQKIAPRLKFNGWKNERILQEFHDGRIIMIKYSDNHVHLKKLTEVKEMVDTELGFTSCQDLYPKAEQKAFLFISLKRIIGCAIALPINKFNYTIKVCDHTKTLKAYPVIPTPGVSSTEKENGVPTFSWCCSTKAMPALCGISRIWVFSQFRRRNIATRIVDCIRHHFLYGCVIEKEKLAFSDPTPNGRIFAEKYTGKSEILVFR